MRARPPGVSAVARDTHRRWRSLRTYRDVGRGAGFTSALCHRLRRTVSQRKRDSELGRGSDQGESDALTVAVGVAKGRVERGPQEGGMGGAWLILNFAAVPWMAVCVWVNSNRKKTGIGSG